MNDKLIISKCENCGREIASLFHTKQCPYCLSFHLKHYFSQSYDNPDAKKLTDLELENYKTKLERIFKYYSVK